MIFFELFYVFFLIGLFTIGGGHAMIPLMEEQMVAHGWATTEEIINFIAISESTPGPFAINMATFIGCKQVGLLGGIVATLGMALPSIIIITIIARIANKFLCNKYVQAAMYGIRPLVIGLIASIVYTLSKTYLVDEFNINMIFIIAICFSLRLKYKKISTVILISIAAMLGIFLL